VGASKKGGVGKSAISSFKCQYLENDSRYGYSYYKHKQEVAYAFSINTKIDDLGWP